LLFSGRAACEPAALQQKECAMNLKDQTVVIVGGGSGIGFGVARACLARGARVVLAGRTASKLERALEALEARERAHAQVADISQEADVARLFEQTARVDHVVVTAADLAYQPIRDFEPSAARRALESKLLGALLVCKHAARRLNPRGSITLTSGVASERPLPRGSMVAAVNGALHSFVRGAALELAPMRVNALSPGWVDSELWDTLGIDKTAAFAAMAQRLPAGRIGQPEDLAHAAIFLLENEFTTGAVLTVDGGHRFA
jgi:NAD(P)-dependent dehydrogenase (short-subunit alcohol dehydrogenase family)